MGGYEYPRLAAIAEPPSKYEPSAVQGPNLFAVQKRKRSKWSMYWLFWVFGMVLTGFVVPELHAILNKQQGDTLSENIRLWLKTDTPGGGASWLAVWSTLMAILIWLLGHILNWWP
jgi:hypothetical protein